MKKQILFIVFILSFVINTKAQQFPIGECGIVVVHDANGCRTKRTYFCNNGVDPWPTRAQQIDANTPAADNDILQVAALFPNPTNGLLNIEFRNPLINANVSFFDLNGKLVRTETKSGVLLKFDLSNLSNGSYVLKIVSGDFIMTKIVIKN